VTQADVNELQTILDEFKNICPEITRCSLFKENGDSLASSQEATNEEGRKVVEAFNSVAGHTEILSGMATLTVQGPDRQLCVLSKNNHYLTTVSTRMASEIAVKSLTTVVVPTVLELMNRTVPNPACQDISPIVEPELVADIVATDSVEEGTAIEQSVSEDPAEVSDESSLLNVSAKQFMVEKIGGLMVASDVVRLDGEVIDEWHSLYENKQIREVQIQTLEGRTTSVKLKITKENEGNSKGIIQIPDKILQALHINKGNLVIVKPVIR
jgi:hypothetical protein